MHNVIFKVFFKELAAVFQQYRQEVDQGAEIKAGMTINRDYFKGLQHIAGILNLTHGSGLIYGGTERQERTDTAIYPALLAHELFSRLQE